MDKIDYGSIILNRYKGDLSINATNTTITVEKNDIQYQSGRTLPIGTYTITATPIGTATFESLTVNGEDFVSGDTIDIDFGDNISIVAVSRGEGTPVEGSFNFYNVISPAATTTSPITITDSNNIEWTLEWQPASAYTSRAGGTSGFIIGSTKNPATSIRFYTTQLIHINNAEIKIKGISTTSQATVHMMYDNVENNSGTISNDSLYTIDTVSEGDITNEFSVTIDNIAKGLGFYTFTYSGMKI